MINIEHKNWTNSAKRYGRKTNITNDSNENWEYETQIKNSSNQLISNIKECYMMIRAQNQGWTKKTNFTNHTILFKIFWIKNKKLYKIIKNYENIEYLAKSAT